MSRWGLACLLGIGSLLGGCSDSPPPEAASNAPAFSVFANAEDTSGSGDVIRRVAGDEDANPVVTALRFEPRDPVSRSRLRAVAEMSGRWTAVEYAWAINGVGFGGSTAEVVLPVVKTGDTVSVEVSPSRGLVAGTGKSASVKVKNQNPMMLGLSIDLADEDARSEFDDLEVWQAVARAEDPDGDRVEFEYKWFVNGVAADVEGEFFRVADLGRGDRLEVEVRAFDGRLWSAPARSGEIEVGNSPPEIVSVPPRVDARGQFRYAIRVEDPDGDSRFRFSLRKSPRGMQIDDINGIVRWEPDARQAGRHSVEIVVTDDGGAESTQSFSLALITRSDPSDSAPAAPR